MKITIFCGYEKNKYTGVGKYVHDLAEQLHSDNIEVIIEYENCYKTPIEKFVERFISLPIRIWRKSKHNSVIILPDEFYVFLLPFIRSSIRTVIIHDVRPLSLSGGKYALIRELFTKIQNKLFLRFANSVIVPSYFTQSCLGRGIIIPNMFDNVDKLENDSFLVNQNLKDKKYLLFVGSSQFRKNFITAKKVAILAKQKYNLDFVCVGNLECTFGKTFTKISNSDLNLLYKHAFVLLNPSLFEGFGRVVIEAQLMECPVISTNCGALAEVLENSALIISNPLNVLEYLHKIELLMDNSLRHDLIQRGLNNSSRFKKNNNLLTAYRSEILEKLIK